MQSNGIGVGHSGHWIWELLWPLCGSTWLLEDIWRHFHIKLAVGQGTVPHSCVRTDGHGVQLGG